MHRLFFYVFGATIRLDGVKERSLALIPSTYSVTHCHPSMALWACHGGPISPLRATSLRSKCNLVPMHRTCVPKALALYNNTRSSTHSTSTSPTPTTWVDRFPPKVQPYLYLTRIDKPIGTLLLFYPCSASADSSGHVAFNVLTVPNVISLVNHHGLICAQCTPIHPSEVHHSVWNRRIDHARGGVHHQRPVGQEPGQRRWYVRSNPSFLTRFSPTDSFLSFFSAFCRWLIINHR